MSRLSPGVVVRVREDYPPGHIRTPVYLRGKQGVVERYFGAFENPERLAYNLTGPKKDLYKVRFRAADLWPDYQGSPKDVIEADIYDHWLETMG
jgi:nitrile hydratase